MLDDLLKAQQGSSGPDQSRKFAEDAPSVPLSKVLQMSLLAMTNPVAFLASGLDLATAKPAGQFGFSDALGLVSGNPVAQLQAAATAVNTAGKSAWQNSLYGTTGSSGVAPGYTSAEESAAMQSANESYGARGGGNASGTDMATGGAVRGPGTSTSDSIPANLSNGEYVIRADVVKRLGVDFFDQLQAEFGRSK
jgi:hypothetical protein